MKTNFRCYQKIITITKDSLRLLILTGYLGLTLQKLLKRFEQPCAWLKGYLDRINNAFSQGQTWVPWSSIHNIMINCWLLLEIYLNTLVNPTHSDFPHFGNVLEFGYLYFKIIILLTILFSYIFWLITRPQVFTISLRFLLCLITIAYSSPMINSLDLTILPEVRATPFCLILAFLCGVVIFFTLLASKEPRSTFILIHWLILSILFCIFVFKGGLNYFILCEIRLIPISLIVLGWGYQPERSLAFSYIFIYTFCFALPLLVVILIIGSFNYQWCISQFDITADPGHNSSIRGFKLVLMLITIAAFMVKFPLYGVHLWLPKAHVEAPVRGSIILAGLLLKIGGFGWFLIIPFITSSPLIWVFSSFRLIGGALIRLACLRQVDIKVIIAYSSVAHLGFVIGAFTSDSSLGFIGGFLIMVTHGLSSPGIFYSANYFYFRSGSRNILLNYGHIQFTPLILIFWFLLCIANIRAPPSRNLLAELFTISSLVNRSFCLIIQLGLLVILRGAYTLLLYSSSTQGQKKSKPRAMMQTSQSELSTLGFIVVLIYLLSTGFSLL